jgi:hypothetical protein
MPRLVCRKQSIGQKNQEKGNRSGKKLALKVGCHNNEITPMKIIMKTKFVNKVIMFEEILNFKQAILLCYGRQKTVTLQQKVLKAQMWVITETIIHCLNLMVTTCAMNQSKGH